MCAGKVIPLRRFYHHGIVDFFTGPQNSKLYFTQEQCSLIQNGCCYSFVMDWLMHGRSAEKMYWDVKGGVHLDPSISFQLVSARMKAPESQKYYCDILRSFCAYCQNNKQTFETERKEVNVQIKVPTDKPRSKKTISFPVVDPKADFRLNNEYLNHYKPGWNFTSVGSCVIKEVKDLNNVFQILNRHDKMLLNICVVHGTLDLPQILRHSIGIIKGDFNRGGSDMPYRYFDPSYGVVLAENCIDPFLTLFKSIYLTQLKNAQLVYCYYSIHTPHADAPMC